MGIKPGSNKCLQRIMNSKSKTNDVDANQYLSILYIVCFMKGHYVYCILYDIQHIMHYAIYIIHYILQYTLYNSNFFPDGNFLLHEGNSPIYNASVS